MALSKLGAMDSATATQLLTSTLNGFRLGASEAESVVDKLIAVDNIAATSANELSTALSYTAAVANQAQVPLEQMIAMIGSVSSTTRQSAEVIGQSFKTILTRMQAVTAGKAVDDFGESLNGVEKTLRSVGIEIRDSKDEFRPLGQVIQEVAANWESYDEVQQQQIVTAMAGVRQANILLALFQNYGDVQKYTEAQLNSTGQAMNRYGIYLEGVEAAQNRVTASWETLWQKSFNQDAIAGVYNLAAGILELVDNLGGLETVLVVATLAMVAFNAKTVANTIVIITAKIGETITFITRFTQSMTLATAAQELFNFVANLNPYVWIPLAIAGIYLLTKAIGTTEQQVERLNKKIDESNNKLSELKDKDKSFTELSKRYRELSEDTSKSKDETQEYTDIQNELKELLPSLIGYYDDYGNFIVDGTKSIEKQGDAIKELIELEKQHQQSLADESAGLLARNLIEAQTPALAAKGKGGLGLKESEKLQIEIDWRNAVEESKVAFQQMSKEGKLAFIKALEESGTRGQLLAKDIFIPLMNEIDKLESAPIEIPAEVVMSTEEAEAAIEELTQAVVEMIKDTKEAEKDALEAQLDNLEKEYDATMELYEAEYKEIQRLSDERKRALDRQLEDTLRLLDAKKKAIEDELDAYNKIIDAEKDRLTLQREQEKYENKKRDKTEELADIEAQIAELALDNSAEAVARRLELEEQAKELRKEMGEDEAEHEYELQMAALEAERKAAEEKANTRLEEIEYQRQQAQFEHDMQVRAIEDAEYAAQRKYEIEKKLIEDTYQAQKSALEAQIKEIEKYLANEVQIRKDAEALVKTHSEDLYKQLIEWNKQYGTGIDEDIIQMWKKALEAVELYSKAVLAAPPPPAGSGSNLPPPNEEQFQYHNYHTGAEGGFVGGQPRIKTNEEFAKLMKGELVVNSSQMDNFMRNILPSIMRPSTSAVGAGGINVQMPINVSGSLDESVLPELKRIVTDTIKKLNDNLMMRGFNRKANQFSI